MFEEMNAHTCTRHICSHRHHHPMHLSAHGEAQIADDGRESSPNTLDFLSFLVHLLLVLSGTMFDDTLGTVFSIGTSDLCFFLLEGFLRYLLVHSAFLVLLWSSSGSSLGSRQQQQ